MANDTPKKSVIIVGGGWAGLTCATELARLGYQITLLESARPIRFGHQYISFTEAVSGNTSSYQHIDLSSP